MYYSFYSSISIRSNSCASEDSKTGFKIHHDLISYLSQKKVGLTRQNTQC